MIGRGKYDHLATYVRKQSKGTGAVVIVIDGKDGHGFSCQCDAATLALLPELLEEIAKQMRRDRDKALQRGGNA